MISKTVWTTVALCLWGLATVFLPGGEDRRKGDAVAPQGEEGPVRQRSRASQFADADGNGICDRRERALGQRARSPCGEARPRCFIDDDGDGICDRCPDGDRVCGGGGPGAGPGRCGYGRGAGAGPGGRRCGFGGGRWGRGRGGGAEIPGRGFTDENRNGICDFREKRDAQR